MRQSRRRAQGAIREILATIDQPSLYISGSPQRIYARLLPCRGSGNDPQLATLDLDYIEAKVIYRKPSP